MCFESGAERKRPPRCRTTRAMTTTRRLGEREARDNAVADRGRRSSGLRSRFLAGTFGLVACLLRGPHHLADEALRSLGAPIAVTDAAAARAEVVVASSWRRTSLPIPGMALGTLKSLAVQAKAPAAQAGWMSKISNPTNHMRPAGGGAFILPSMVGVSPPA